MKLLKLLFVLSVSLLSSFHYVAAKVVAQDDHNIHEEQELSEEEIKTIHKKLIKNLVPDVHIKEQTKEDKELLKSIRPLFCEYSTAGADTSWRKVYDKSINDYGAQEVILNTEDGYRISALYFKRPKAVLNIIYVTGYFHDETPPKEWCAPFAALNPEYNIFCFDWRGIGSSDGSNLFLEKNSFGTNAYRDIQAALEYVKKDNNKPVMIHGFCFGGAMVMHATLQAKKQNKPTADAIGVSCIFPKFENLFERAILVEDRWYYRLLLKTGIGESILDYMMDGTLFDMWPVEFVKDLNLPIYFDHFSNDPFAVLAGGIQVYNAKTNGLRYFVKSDIGRHVRIHGTAPFQYRNAFNGFLRKAGLLS